MRMVIHGKHLSVTPGMRNYAEEKIGKVAKFYDNILEIDVTLSADKLKTGHHHTVEALIYIPGAVIKGTATDSDLYVALDEVTHILETQIKKIKEKREGHHVGHVKRIKLDAEVGTVEKEALKSVVSTNLSPRPMNLEEAILQLECLNRDFYAFTNSETGEMNVVYHKDNGDYGHIQPNK